MKKIFLLLLTTLCTLPNLANAYNCWSTLKSASPITYLGSITPPSGAGYSTIGSRTYATAANYTGCATAASSMDFTVAVPAGYAIAAVKIDGVTVGTTPGTYTVNKGVKTSHTIAVTYSAALASYTITTVPAAGGTITKSFSATAGSALTIDIVPAVGWELTGVTVNSRALDGTTTPTLAEVVAAKAYKIASLDQNYTIAPTFSPAATASAKITTPSGVYALNTNVTVDGSQSTSNVADAEYVWSITPATGATLVANAPNAKTATFNATAPGEYTLTLTVNAAGVVPSPSATVTFSVLSETENTVQSCAACHADLDPPVLNAYLASRHYTVGETSCVDCHGNSHPIVPTAAIERCGDCHDPAIDAAFAASAHAGNAYQILTCASCHANHSFVPAAQVCFDCHHGLPTSTHATADLASQCASCHNPHSTVATVEGLASHSGGAFDGTAAQYLGQNSACSDCHFGGSISANTAILTQFADSGHADTSSAAWITTQVHDWPILDDCKRCHTAAGFVDDATGSTTAVASGQPGQILACSACHDSLDSDQVRSIGPFQAAFDNNYSSAPSSLFPDEGRSNICIRCHSGRAGGSTIKNSTADFSNAAFTSPHFLAAAGTLFRTGYHFLPDSSYISFSGHIGIDGNQGPCVGCHMGEFARDHRFNPLERDETGAITAVVSDLCSYYCHQFAEYPSLVPQLNAKENGFAAALDALEAKLKAVDIHYYPAEPFFYTEPFVGEGTNVAFTDWNSVFLKGKDAMGAAFNFHLLEMEPGAFAHNQLYGRRLIYDSMDFLDNGVLNGYIDLTSHPNAAAYLNPAVLNAVNPMPLSNVARPNR